MWGWWDVGRTLVCGAEYWCACQALGGEPSGDAWNEPSGKVSRQGGLVSRAGRSAEREVSRREGQPSGKVGRAGGQPAGR
jgi:hypothetical protein